MKHSIAIDYLAKPPVLSCGDLNEINRKCDEFFKKRGMATEPTWRTAANKKKAEKKPKARKRKK